MAQPTFDEFLAQAKPLNPEYSDELIRSEYDKAFPSTAPVAATGAPSLEDFVTQAKPLNPDYSDEQITEQYHLAYGAAPEPSSLLRRAADPLIGLAKGVVDLPKALIGLADIGTGGDVGRGATLALEALGKDADALGLPRWARPSQWSLMLAEHYSPETQAAVRSAAEETKRATDDATARGEDWLGQITASATGAATGLIKHPAAAIPLISENLPQMYAIAKGVSLALKPLQAALDAKVAAGTLTSEAANTMLGKAASRASAVGEGLISAGQVSSQISADQPDAGFIEHLAAGAAGILTGGIAHLTGKIPGLDNPEAVLAKRLMGRPAGFTGSLPERIAKGVLAEGVIQEPLQSGQEQIWQNIAEGKPWHEGVGEQVIQGLVAGSAIGGTAGTFGGPTTISKPLPPSGGPPERPPEPHPIQPILDATTTDEVIAAANIAVDKPAVTTGDLDAFIQSQTEVGDQIATDLTTNLDTLTTEAQHAEDQKALESVLSFMGEKSEVTFDERGNSFYQGAPIDVIKKASLPDVTPPEGGLSKEKFDVLQAIAGTMGKHVVFYEDRENLPAGVTLQKHHPTTIFLTNKPISTDYFTVLFHEATHLMEGTEFHKALRDAVWETRKPAWKAYAIAHHGEGLSNDTLLDEAVADISGTELHKPELWEKIFTNLRDKVGEPQAKTEMNSFIDTIKGIITKIKALIASRPWASGLGSSKGLLAEQYVTDLTKLHDALAAGVADAIYKRKGSKPDTGKMALAKKPAAAPREILHPDTVMRFKELASAQRGAPESAMLNVQKVHGGGVLNPVVENVGDLIHRMTEMSAYGEAQRENVLSKIERSIRALTDRYGFEKEHNENLRNNARYNNQPVAELRAAVDAALLTYAKEHKKLPVYNKAHWLAREAAVAVGEQRFDDAVTHLKALKTLASSKEFGKAAFEYAKDDKGKLRVYEPSTSEDKVPTSTEKAKTGVTENANILPSVGHELKFSKKTVMTDEDKELAKLYDDAPLFEKKAKSAWNELKKETDRLYKDLIKTVKVERVTGQPYADEKAMNVDIAKGTFKVTTDNSEHPLWSVEDNFKFRVVHDYIGHFETGFDFGLDGERMAFEYHASRLKDSRAVSALKVEVYGQAAAAIAHNGEFQPQKIFLLPEKEAYDYASTQIDLAPAIAKKVFAISQQIKVEDLTAEGRETAPHLTVKYGLHSEDPAQAAGVLTGAAPVSATIGDIGMFEREEYDVIALMVDSPQLVEINTKISDALENTTDFTYSPHITVAFVKPGLGKGYVSSLRNTLKNTIVRADEITFSNKKGEKTPITLGQTVQNVQNVQLEHYSKTGGLTEISPKFHGTGQIGAERRRMENEGKAYLPRTYFYRAGTAPEARFKGLTKYTVNVPEDRLVDLATLSGSPTDREQLAKKQGYLGFYNSESSMPDAVALFETVKVEKPAERTERPRFAPRIWFSQLGNTLIDKMPVRASKEQVRGIIASPGIKTEEVKWTGILDYVDTLTEPIFKDELLKWLGEHHVVVNEVVNREGAGEVEIPEELQIDIAQFTGHWEQDGTNFYFPNVKITLEPNAFRPTDHNYVIQIGNDFVGHDTGNALELVSSRGDAHEFANFSAAGEAAYEFVVNQPRRALEEANSTEQRYWDRASETKFSGYTLPGGTDYTELLLTLPFDTHADDLRMVAEAQQQNRTGRLENISAGGYRSPHFDEPNILAHVRFKTRQDGAGKTVLFLEEVQSDWHERGREKGYRGDKHEPLPDHIKIVPREIRRVNREDRASSGTVIHYDVTVNGHTRITLDTSQEAEEAARNFYNAEGVPDAPFKTTWPELVMKRMLRFASEHGFDKLAWTTGAQQNERYGLARTLSELRVERMVGTDPSTYRLTGVMKDGRQHNFGRFFDAKDLPEAVGKELALKIISQKQDEFIYSGLDLEVGGSGMKYFYDQMLPRFMEKYLKPWGTKVEGLPIDMSGINGIDTSKVQTVHSISLTPEMKASVIQRGQPMFAPRTRPSTYVVEPPSTLDKIERVLRDKNVDIKRIVEAIQASGRTVPEWLNPVLAEEMFQKRDEQRAKDFTNDELRPLIDAMRLQGVTVKQLDDYLHARHVIDDNLNARLSAINPDLAQSPNFNKLSGLTDLEAQAILKNANRPVMDALARQVDDMVNTTRDLMVQYGLEKQSTIDEWRKAYKHYIPLRREGFDEQGNPTGTGKSVRGSTAKERGGSGLAVENILANIAQARDQIVTRGEKNRVVTSMAGLMMIHPNPSIATLDKPAVIVMPNPATGLNMIVPGNLTNYQVPTIRRFDPVSGTMKTYPDPTYKGRDNVVNFRVNGEDYAIVFEEHNERAMEAAKAFKNLGTPQLNGIMKAVAPYTRYLAAVNTQYNPIFGLVNFVRDAQYAMLTLSSTPIAGHQATVLKNAIGSLSGIYQDARSIRQGSTTTSATARLWQRFEHVGGPTGYRDLFFTAADRAKELERLMDPHSWKGTFRPQALGKRVEETAMFKWLSDYNLTMENAIRLGVFKTAVDNGLSDLMAASLAKNITVNFNKKGQIGAQMGSLYAFFNANVQGTARILETLFERTPGGGFRISSVGKKIIAGGVLIGVLQTFALTMAGFDDDDPPEFVKQKNLVIPIPGTGKGYAMIPMPLGFNLLPNIGRLAAETIVQVVNGKPGNVLDKGVALLGSLYNTMSPVGGTGDVIQELSPTVVDPFAALRVNKDWTGKSIAKEDRSSLDPTPGHTRAHDTATFWARALSKAINWATGGSDYTPGIASPTPDQIDFLISQALGGIGREISKGAQVAQSLYTGEELPTHKIPLVGRFYGSTEGSTAVRSRFYEHVKAANIAYNEFEGRALHHEPFSEYIKTHPEARFAKVAIIVQDDLAILQKQKQRMLDQGAGKDAIRLQEQKITNLMNRFNELVEKAQLPQ